MSSNDIIIVAETSSAVIEAGEQVDVIVADASTYLLAQLADGAEQAMTQAVTSADQARQSATAAAASAETSGYAPGTRISVGINRPLIGVPVDGGGALAWSLPVQPVAMRYDSFCLELTAGGTGQLVIWSRHGDGFRRAAVAPVTLAAGFNTLALTLLVPAGGAVSYERVTGGNVMVAGYAASPAQNGSFPVGGAPGDVAVRTPRSHDYGFGASGFAIEEAPAQIRVAAEARANALVVSGPKSFVRGTYLPRHTELATWQARGIDTIVTMEADFALQGQGDAFEAAWKASGMKIIRRLGRHSDPGFTALQTLAQARADAADPRVLAWAMWDEMDLFGHPAQPGFGGVFDPDLTRPYVEQEIASLRQVGFSKPIFANISGYNLSIGQAPWRARHLDNPGINWWGCDQYPNVGAPAGFLMPEQSNTYRFATTCVGMAVAQMVQADMNYGGQSRPAGSIGKPAFFHVATGRTSSVPGAYETPGRLRCILWSGLINGASGYILFPQFVDAPGGYISDDSDPALIAELAKFNQALAILEGLGALMDPDLGGRRAFTPRRCAWAPFDAGNQNAAFITPRDLQLPGPFEGCEIPLADGDILRLVLNLKSTAQALTDARWSAVGMAFTAYQARAFKASAPTVDLLAGVY